MVLEVFAVGRTTWLCDFLLSELRGRCLISHATLLQVSMCTGSLWPLIANELTSIGCNALWTWNSVQQLNVLSSTSERLCCKFFLHRSAGSYWTWSAIDQTWTAWWFDVPGSQMRLCQSKKLCPIPRKDIDRAAVIQKPPLGKPRSRIEQVSRWVLSADGLTRYHRYVISVSIHHDIYLGYKMRSSTVTPRLIFYFRLACTMVDMISTTYGALLLGSSLAYSFVLVSARFCRYWTEVNRLTGVLCFQCATYFKLYREDRHVIKYLVRFLIHFACSISLCHFTRYRSFGSSNYSIRV